MEFTLHEVSGPIRVTLSVSLQGRDGIFWLYGGDRSHIGAVALREREGAAALFAFPGHREDGIVSDLAGALGRDGRLEHMVVCGGIHYDQIDPAWIPEIVALCGRLGERCLRELDRRIETGREGT